MPISSAIPPLPDTSVCPSCALFQARGTTCPPVRPAYELERLRMAIQTEAGSVMSFADLVRRDAEAMAGQKRPLALMPGATTELFPNTNKKEADAVVQQTRTRSPR